MSTVFADTAAPRVPPPPPTRPLSRLLYIGQNPAAGTGSPVLILRHLKRFAQDGWPVTVLADYGGDYADCTAAGFTVQRLPHRRWWWPPHRENLVALRRLRLRLLARDVAAGAARPDVVVSYLASHTDFTAQLAVQVARVTGAPLHMIVHDDATAFPAARGRESAIRHEHERILRAADHVWFISPELAERHRGLDAGRTHVLLPIPEGWSSPATWNAARVQRPQVFYAGHLWPEQIPLLRRLAERVGRTGGQTVALTKASPPLRELVDRGELGWHPLITPNRDGLQYLVDHAAALLVSYADTVAEMPWSGSSFPSKLVEYCHLGLPIAIVSPRDSAVGQWALRSDFPYFFEPGQLDAFEQWCAGLAHQATWEKYGATSLQVARHEFDPDRIHAGLAEGVLAVTRATAP